ncbi:MAG: hypothetical protein H7Y17_15030 [Chlorobia bacterium]|nr:hypothetical protein [Fimbriimonadaceae bacterium]
MALAAVSKIKDAAHTGATTLRAAKGHSQHSAELRRQLGISAVFAVVAGTAGFFALRAIQSANRKATDHVDWKIKDSQLDKDLEDSLDASDALARF